MAQGKKQQIIFGLIMGPIAFILEGTSITTWIQKYVINLPFALFWQIVICGPFVRALFAKFTKPAVEVETEAVIA